MDANVKSTSRAAAYHMRARFAARNPGVSRMDLSDGK